MTIGVFNPQTFPEWYFQKYEITLDELLEHNKSELQYTHSGEMSQSQKNLNHYFELQSAWDYAFSTV